MSTTNCPKCGKPLRPGARFCGNCGATIPAAAQAVGAPQIAEGDVSPCPNCGKPVRRGAKFCTHCGTKMAEQGGEPPATSRQEQPVPQMLTKTGVVSPGAGGPAAAQAGAPAPGAAASRPGRRALWPVLLLAIVLLCVVGAAGGVMIYRDPFNLLKPARPSPAAVNPVDTATATEPATLEPSHTPTQEEIIPTFTPEASPTHTQQPLETLAATPSVTVSVELTQTTAPISGEPVTTTILEDEFSENLSENWRSWGNPFPTLRKGFGDSWLDLKAADKAGEAGTTTRKELSLAPGVWLVWEAQLNPTYPQFSLFLDWDPAGFMRGPSNSAPTQLRYELQKSRVLLLAPVTNAKCDIALDGTTKHTFALFLVDEQKVDFFIDDLHQSLCQLDLGVTPGLGRISFSGNGWVTRIRVSDSPAQ